MGSRPCDECGTKHQGPCPEKTRALITYCQAAECNEGPGGTAAPTEEGRPLCPMHMKRLTRDPSGRNLGAPKKERPSGPEEAAIAAGHAWLDSDAEDDGAYERNRKKALSAFRELGRYETSQRISEGMRAAKARGVALGPAPKLAGMEDVVRRMVERVGQREAAEVLGVARETVRKAVQRAAMRGPGPQGKSGDTGGISGPGGQT